MTDQTKLVTDEQIEKIRESYLDVRDSHRGVFALLARIEQDRSTIARQAEELTELREWRDKAVASCAKRQCSMRDATIAALNAENASLRERLQIAESAAMVGGGA